MNEETKIEIPEVVYPGDDEKLKERVSKFKAGTFRIAVFTLVGFIMGLFSHTYVRDHFFPTKLIMAIPYKITETIYVFILGTDAEQMYLQNAGIGFLTEFFPHSYIATFLAETVTTVLIGGAIYGALAYFTGDKRVFTLQRFLKFAGIWCAVILLAVGAAYGVNAKAVHDNEAFKGKPYFFLYDSHGSGSGAYGAETERLMREYFYSELEPVELERNYDGELDLEISFGYTRLSMCRVNYEDQYVVTEQGKIYHISKEFADVIRGYDEGQLLPGMVGATEASEEIMSEEVKD